MNIKRERDSPSLKIPSRGGIRYPSLKHIVAGSLAEEQGSVIHIGDVESPSSSALVRHH